MCTTINLRLNKFASNSKTVLEALPVKDRFKDLKDLDLRHDVLPVLHSLGTYWCIESKTLLDSVFSLKTNLSLVEGFSQPYVQCTIR